jgi:acyl dehydratase
MLTFESPGQLKDFTGQELGVTNWVAVSQERIDRFAAATGDGQWIHVDVERAQRESPYGTTVAHGFLTLSLLTQFVAQTVGIRGLKMGVNYGLNRVRFPTPVRAGSRVRGRIELQSLREFEGGAEPTFLVIVECEDPEGTLMDKPCCVAEWVVRYYG